ncbi:MAG: mandelate racemase, partial [Burkholderiaceae bacterium]
MAEPRSRLAPAPNPPTVGETPWIESLDVDAFRVPTDAPESDGTLEWHSTTLVLVRAHSAGQSGMGIGYADRASASLAREVLAPLVEGGDALSPASHRSVMLRAVRNMGRAGIAAMAIATVDNALWDLKARLLGLSLDMLLGAVRESVPV